LHYKITRLIPVFPLVVLVTALFLAPFVIAAPPDMSSTAIGHRVEKAGVSLEKRASADTVPLGQVVSYTVSVKNNSSKTIDATLTDALPKVPEGLALQYNVSTSPIITTTGVVEADNNTLIWTFSLAPDEETSIIYGAIPPTTSTPGQTIENVARLKFGETTLEAAATITTQPPDFGGGFWAIWGAFVNFIALALIFLDQLLASAGIPFAFGFAIILFTIIVRVATFPLNMQQIKSSKAMQELQPKLKLLQEKYKGDREKLAQEQMALYREHGVNPLGGCLPMLVQMPIWFALYRSLIQLSQQGLLNEPFLWIPNLAGPVSDYSQGIGWLWSVGWADAIAYMVMPVLLVVSQFYMQQLMTPPSSDPQQAQMQNMMKFMPLMFGYFSLIVPSGLTLYWFTSNILGVAQHYFTKTQLESPLPITKPTVSGSSSPPLPATAGPTNPTPGDSGEDNKDDKKQKHARPKRKSRRKR
jgi:YidC/Oxa1 family membrane protein insertase